MKQLILLIIISTLHGLLIGFEMLAPLTGDDKILLIHIILTLFLVIHWTTNDHTCVVTQIEEKLIKDLDIILDKDIFNQSRITAGSYIGTLSLGLISFYRLYG